MPRLGGRAFDAVVLHTLFTDETTARCVRTVKRAAEEAGRDPARVRVWSCFAPAFAFVRVLLRGPTVTGARGGPAAMRVRPRLSPAGRRWSPRPAGRGYARRASSSRCPRPRVGRRP
jgi:alkanesulfonate monooxygenase SsuD/methylene tetrahydromethanopterin reductase-like flavin-dependent oxidoreductase (luciferase family)